MTAPEAPPTTAEAASAAAEGPTWLGRTVDNRYQIRELLGEGGMGAVYSAEHLGLRKQVAFKVIRAEYADNEEIAARFTREAMATAQIDHPNVASALDYGRLPDGGAYLVTQLVRGRSLEHHRSTGKMPWRRVCDLGAQIADALAAAHAIHIVHRDLKPDNILLEPRDDGGFRVKVLDFGIARVTTSAVLPASDLTRMGAVIGTPGYMAPEQARGEAVDLRVDLYALGVILWECTTGRVLWDGDTISDIFTRQLVAPAPPLAAQVPELPPEFAALVDLMLERNPKRRPESARNVRDALRRMAHGTLVAGTAPVAPPRRRPSRWPLWAAAALVAVLAAAALWDREPAAPATPDEPTGVAAPAGVATPAGLAAPAAVASPSAPQAAPADMSDPPGTNAQAGAEAPSALGEAIEALASADRGLRKRAAETVLAHEPQDAVPLHARNVAALERASSCEGKRAAIKKIAEAGDPQALPALKLLARTPRKGCGVFKSRDCFECMRDVLTRTIRQLEGK